MADIVGSLFGISSDQLQQQRAMEDNRNALLFSQLNEDQAQRFIGYKLGGMLGNGVSKLLGAKDPQLERATALEGALKEASTEAASNDPIEVYSLLSKKLADRGLMNESLQVQQELAKQVQERQLNNAKVLSEQAQASKYSAEADLKTREAENDAKAKIAMQELYAQRKAEGKPLSQEDIVMTVAPYMSADKLGTILQQSQDKAAYRDFALQQTAMQAQARIEAAIQRGADARELAQMRLQAQKDLAMFNANLKLATAKLESDKPLSGREARYSDNVAIAGNEVVGGINNIVNLPALVTGGIWGGGVGQIQSGTGLFEAPIGALKQNMTTEAVQRYNAEISNIGKYYSTLQTGGLQSSATAQKAFEDQFRIPEGSKPLTALTKLAQMRQTFERVAEIKMKSKATPKEQLPLWEDWLAQVQTSIPISVNDINRIANERDKTKTFKDSLATASGGKVSFTLPAGTKVTPQIEKEIQQAIQAIEAGKDPQKVREKLQQRIGVKVD